MINEERFKEEAKKVIDQCRPGDWNHAKRVVEWVKVLGREREDLSLIVAAAYIHDIGWRGMISEDKITFEKLLSLEQKANDNSKKYIREFLKNLDFKEQEIETVCRLVKAADTRKTKAEEEAIIVDADNLSKLTIVHLKEKFEKSEWLGMHELWVKEFPVRIHTGKGKSLYPQLLEDLKKSIEIELV